ncbi:MAG: hypothetical protein WDN23_11435 [Edaphobacter sp.]
MARAFITGSSDGLGKMGAVVRIVNKSSGASLDPYQSKALEDWIRSHRSGQATDRIRDVHLQTHLAVLQSLLEFG